MIRTELRIIEFLRMSEQLWTHQIDGIAGAIERLKAYNGALLDYGMGTGKSRIAIEIINRLRPSRVLIVAPKVAVEGSWSGQLKQWLNDNHAVAILDRGTAHKRAKLLAETLVAHEKSIVVVNYEIAIRTPLAGVIAGVRWGLTIFDESHRLKSPSASRTEYFRDLANRDRKAHLIDPNHKVGFRIMLSGTPMPNGLEELYAQYAILNPAIFGSSFSGFKSRYCETEPAYRDAPRFVRKVVGYRNLEEFERRRAILSIVRRTEDCLDLPDCIDREIEVSLKPSTLKMILELAKKGMTTAPDGTVVAPENAAGRAIKSMMLSSGVLKYEVDTFDSKTELVDDAKLKALESLLEDTSNERVVVFARWTRDLETTRDVTQKRKRDYFEISGTDTTQRGETLDAWRSTRNGVIGVQIQAGGEGIDLTASRIGIFISRTHSAGNHKQAIARLVTSRTDKVSLYYLDSCTRRDRSSDNDRASAQDQKFRRTS